MIPFVAPPVIIYRGDDFTMPYRIYVPNSSPRSYVDLTGWRARAQLRRSDELLATFDTFLSDQVANRGGFTINLASVVTAALSPGPAVFDVELISPTGQVGTVLTCEADVTPDVTR